MYSVDEHLTHEGGPVYCMHTKTACQIEAPSSPILKIYLSQRVWMRNSPHLSRQHIQGTFVLSAAKLMRVFPKGPGETVLQELESQEASF